MLNMCDGNSKVYKKVIHEAWRFFKLFIFKKINIELVG